jgi:predicted dehydrogenase
MQPIRIAFAGFRHGHIIPLYKQATVDSRVQVVAACEEHQPTATTVESSGVRITHRSYGQMLREVGCDAIAVGDYFARRGEIIIAALEAKKHVIADKPICTSVSGLDQIAHLSRENNRFVSALLDLRDSGAMLTARKLIRSGAIGEVHTITFTAQHPLFYGQRAAWYFEEGKHGGTINDIAVHATDLLPWMTGRQLIECVAARAWNARLGQHPHFQDAAQMMLKLDNGGGVLGDVSYLSPDGLKYSAPQYWRITCHGDGGMIEAKYGASSVMLAKAQDASIQQVEAEPDVPTGRLDAFVAEVSGSVRDESALTTSHVIDASRRALLIQLAADESRTHVTIGGR